MASVSEEKVSGIDTHFRKCCISGIDTFGIVSPITSKSMHMELYKIPHRIVLIRIFEEEVK